MSNNIGLNIKKYRKEKGLTQTELADKLGKTLRTVQKYESGEILPSINNVYEIAEALEVFSNDIIGGVAKGFNFFDVDIEEKKEMIDHPSHYNQGKFEAIDVIEDWKLNFNLGNTVKYISRAGHKDNIIQDLKKASWYLNREIERLEKGE
ncbi:DUF3310 domain-containing protein [uncultured Megamonas sp.]|uniref:DUF3310 domain-containing protein n=1 Tax=uncultured Megamonas sp. TaxID=286140 RepID=UPI00259B77E2|nr:DUF3310 domain-containing protein [uncultured Megamonas sp.]